MTEEASSADVGHDSNEDVPSNSSGSAAKRAPIISFDSTTKQNQQPLPVHKKSDVAAPAPILKTSQPIIVSDDDEDPKIQAISNLRCPSPPPILNKPTPQASNSSGNSSIKQPIPSQQPIRSATPQQQQQQQQQQMPSILVQSNPASPGSVKAQYSSDGAKSPISRTSSTSSPLPISASSSSIINQNPMQQKDTIPAGGAILRGRAAAQAIVAAVAAQTARDRNRARDSSPLTFQADEGDEEEALSVENLQINEKQFSHHKAPSMHAHFYVDEALRHGPITVGSRSRSGSGSTNESRNISEVIQLDSNHNFVKKSTSTIAPTGALQVPQPQVPSQQQQQQPSAPFNQGGIVTKQTVDARLPSDDNKLHVLFGICGTISTKKTRLIINKLEEIYGPDKISIQIIITSAAEHFVSRGEFPSSVPIWRDKDEWTTWGGRSDPVLHIELRRWADILVIAPLTSNTLSKIALGLCDNLLTNVVRAWNTQYPILVAPAMVSYAYNSPITRRHLKVIKEEMKWIEILRPTEKVVGSYGDIGMGGMMDWNEIVKTICLKAHELGFNDDDEDEDDADDNDNGRDVENNDEEDEDEEEEEDVDDDDEEVIKLSVAEEDEIEKVLKK